MAHDWIAVRARAFTTSAISTSTCARAARRHHRAVGSGKSSLAFDTIYAEGQRRYVESLSVYARQFLEQMEKPDVDLIEGLSPAISIEQKTTVSNPRSTVGTVTEIYDYLRLLFANIGIPHCPRCGSRSHPSRSSGSWSSCSLRTGHAHQRPRAGGPRPQGGVPEGARRVKARGFTRARIDGQFRALEDEITLERRRNHTIDVVVDRVVVRPGVERRLAESVETALTLADQIVVVNTLDGGDRLFSRRPTLVSSDVEEHDLSRCAVNLPSAKPIRWTPSCARRGITCVTCRRSTIRVRSMKPNTTTGCLLTRTRAALNMPPCICCTSRFFHKALRDMGITEGNEPMMQLRNQGMVLAEDNSKMSKSKGNVVAPDMLVNKYGADTVRAYLMFFARWEMGAPWDSQGIEGTARWMRRVWTLFTDPTTPRDAAARGSASDETKRTLRRRVHQTLQRVTNDFENFEFNTIISSLMELLNEMYKAREAGAVGTPEWAGSHGNLFEDAGARCAAHRRRTVDESIGQAIFDPSTDHGPKWMKPPRKKM